MKIALILIVHLGLVACGNNATNASLPCLQCEALEEIRIYTIKKAKADDGTIILKLVDKYIKQGLVTAVLKEEIKKVIPSCIQSGCRTLFGIKAESAVKCSGLCSCPKSAPQGPIVMVDKPVGLNDSASNVVLKAYEGNVTAFSCLMCRATNMLLRYIKTTGEDKDGALFWNLMDRITKEDALDRDERDNFGKVLKFEYIPACRGESYDPAAEQVIRYIKHKNPSSCCQRAKSNDTVAVFNCTLNLPKRERAIQLLQDFINLNYQCPRELSSMVTHFFVEGSITLDRWNAYDQLIKGELKRRPKKVAELVLKDLKFNNGIKKLEDYKFDVKINSSYDPQGKKIFKLMSEFKDEDLMSQSQYDQGMLLWKGNNNPSKLAEYVEKMLVANHGY